jgi:predicted metal-binding protein
MMGNNLVNDGQTLNKLLDSACRQGASGAKVISAADILAEDDLVDFCRNSGCEYFGLSIHCPPHVSGPTGFRELLKDYTRAILFKIDVPTEILLSKKRLGEFRRLHEIAAHIEQAAVEMGHGNAKAFVGGSCKPLFCQDHEGCRVLAEGGDCRHPQVARPSMSGYGINVSKLMESAGWSMERITRKTDPDAVSMGMLCGLILID